MRARLILNLVLVLVVALGGALLYFEPWAEPPEKEPRLVDIAPEAVNRVTIDRTGADGGTVVLQRGDDGWRVSEPFAMRASATQVDSLIQNLRQRTKDHFPVGDRDLAGFGLAEPALRVTVNDTELAIGGEAPIERARYVKIGETIHVAGTALKRSADKPATGFVARRLVPKDAKISAIEGPSFKVVRATQNDDATWSVARSDVEPAKDAAGNLANVWATATARKVERRPDGGQPATATVRVRLEGRDAPLEFRRLGDGKDDVTDRAGVVTRPDLPVRYVVSGPTAEQLFQLEAKESKSGGNGTAKQKGRGDQKS